MIHNASNFIFSFFLCYNSIYLTAAYALSTCRHYHTLPTLAPTFATSHIAVLITILYLEAYLSPAQHQVALLQHEVPQLRRN